MYKKLDQSFWNDRWELGNTGWDMGYPSPAIVKYMEQFENKSAAILIPGCGNAYEAEFLVSKGFENITLIDIAPKAIDNLKKKFEYTDAVRVFCVDFFDHLGSFDLVLEQTFFCALPTELRANYAQKMHQLLKQGGQLVGLLFNKNFEKPGPPFGGDIEAYRLLFAQYFYIKKMEECYNSIPPRKGAELFVHLINQ